MKHSTQKLLKPFRLLLVLGLIGFQPLPASAGLFGGGGIKIPTASQFASELENRYHLNLGNIQDQGENFNVAENKLPFPEVSLRFTPTDPREGEKITARAFPMYYSNPENALYFTWYLKRDRCDLTKSPSSEEEAICDHDGDDEVTVEDWKIEAARLLAQNGYVNDQVNYSSDSDSDGYRANRGGDNKTNAPDHCYVHDSITGTNFELATNIGDESYGCAAGFTPVCMVGSGSISSGTNEELEDGEPYFQVSDNDSCYVSGYPACSDNDTPVCPTGTAYCVADATANACPAPSQEITSCVTADSSADPYCRHLFPHAPDQTSGDGSFGAREEEFWGTNPNDSSTASNGKKDEANVVGLGASDFTWNYITGDKVGVVVEGTSTISTKYDDSSSMILMAFPKNDCPISLAEERGSFTRTIQGYRVNMPAVDMDLNKCIAYLDGDGDEHELNLVDPTQGGQPTNLDVSVTSIPDAPLNDESGDGAGDIIVAQASIGNSNQSSSNIVFDWSVEMSNNIQFNSAIGTTGEVTEDLADLELLGNTRGNALDALRLKMDIPNRSGVTLDGRRLGQYLINGIGYLRFRVTATENFSGGVIRRGQSDVIVKFTSTGRKITAYKAEPELVSGAMQVTLPGSSGIICQNDPLERNVCPVMKNEIIGLRLDPQGLDGFRWSVNGQALGCTRENVSPDCGSGEQNEINFIPVVGNTGDTYTVTVAATDVQTGAAVNVSRTFQVVEPSILIESANADQVWPKLLGQYRDITGSAAGCPDGLCNDYSETIFETASGNELAFRAKFIPSFLGRSAVREWTVDNAPIAESADGEIRFTAVKEAPAVYNLSLAAQTVQSAETRRALLDIWNISPLETPETTFAVAGQVEVGEAGLASGPLGSRKYLVAVSSYLPASLLFSLRILLSGGLIILVMGLLFSFMPLPPQSQRR